MLACCIIVCVLVCLCVYMWTEVFKTTFYSSFSCASVWLVAGQMVTCRWTCFFSSFVQLPLISLLLHTWTTWVLLLQFYSWTTRGRGRPGFGAKLVAGTVLYHVALQTETVNVTDCSGKLGLWQLYCLNLATFRRTKSQNHKNTNNLLCPHQICMCAEDFKATFKP